MWWDRHCDLKEGKALDQLIGDSETPFSEEGDDDDEKPKVPHLAWT